MRIGLTHSTQNGNLVVGGGTEAAYAQDIARRLKPLLEQAGHTCMIFAGETDANTDGARALVAWGCDYSLSIHSDAGGGVPYGSLCCYQEQRSLPWCRAILETFCSKMGTVNRGYMVRTPGVNGVAVIRIPESAGIKTMLIETVRHDVDSSAVYLRDPEWRQKAAKALSQGIISFIGGTIPKKKSEEDDDVYVASVGHAAWVPSMTKSGMKCYLDISNQSASDTEVRYFFRRDNGDFPRPEQAVKRLIKGETTDRFEVGALWSIPEIGGVTVKVEVLSGGPVIVTRKQTMG